MKELKIAIYELCLHIGDRKILENVTLNIRANRVTSVIGPSGAGKSSFLRTINRMIDLYEQASVTGSILIDGIDIYGKDLDVVTLRRKVGMIDQKPNLFPKSIFENIVFAPRLSGIKEKQSLEHIVEANAIKAGVWNEIKDRLSEPAYVLSTGQQQRVCIARALAAEPEILLLDEPTAALDPVSTSQVEELIHSLKKDYTIIAVTHNMQQAGRISDYTAFLYNGSLIEYDKTSTIFTNPSSRQTEEYVTGRLQ
jgi:phosphate transport system ATP-binding protein